MKLLREKKQRRLISSPERFEIAGLPELYIERRKNEYHFDDSDKLSDELVKNFEVESNELKKRESEIKEVNFIEDECPCGSPLDTCKCGKLFCGNCDFHNHMDCVLDDN